MTCPSTCPSSRSAAPRARPGRSRARRSSDRGSPARPPTCCPARATSWSSRSPRRSRGGSGSSGAVAEDDDAAVEGGRVDEVEAAGRPGVVEPVVGRAGADEEGVHPQAQLVEEPGGHERVREPTEAVLQDAHAGLLFEVADGLDRIVVDDRRVVPLRIGERRRDDVLGQRVHPVAERVARAGRPRGSEAVVGVPTHQQRVAPLQQLELDPAAVVAEATGHGPVLRILDHAVEGHVGRVDDGTHSGNLATPGRAVLYRSAGQRSRNTSPRATSPGV